MPKPLPAELRADVVAVAHKGEAPLRQIAKDFGISEACVHRWRKTADRPDDGERAGSSSGADDAATQLGGAHKRIKLLGAGGRGDASRIWLPAPGRQPK